MSTPVGGSGEGEKGVQSLVNLSGPGRKGRPTDGSFRIWERAFDLSLEIIRLTNRFPRSEGNGLTSEIRTSAILLPSYIAAGRGRRGPRSFLRNLYLSMSTLSRIEIQVLICAELGFLGREDLLMIEKKVLEIRRLAGRLIRWLRGDSGRRRSGGS